MAILAVKVPPIGESITEVTVARLMVKSGDIVKRDQVILEFDSDKATLELPAEAAGMITLQVAEGDELKIGDTIGIIDTNAAAPAAPAENKATSENVAPLVPPTSPPVENYATGYPSPAAQKIMSEKGLSSDMIKGTGVDGRITKQDVLTVPSAVPPPAEQVSAPVVIETNAPAEEVIGSRNSRIEKMTRIRKTISARLVAAKNTTAMLTTFNEVDLTEIIALRAKYKESFQQKHGIGLGFMSFFAKSSAKALEEFPLVNAYINEKEGTIEFHDFVDISIAVSTPRGLVVPVLRNVERMALQDIEKGIKDLATKGRDNALTMEDMTGGTFTITNGGVFGSMLSTPILNPPQSAILGMHNITERPVVINGEIKVRSMMYLALSYDHRIIDGKEAVSFLVRIKQLLEDPIRLLLEV